MDDGHVEAYIAKGQLLTEKNCIEEAIKVFRKAVFLSHELSAFEGLIHAYLLNGNARGAFEIAKSLFTFSPVARTMTLLAVSTQHMAGRQNEVSFISFKNNKAKTLLQNLLSAYPNCIEAVITLVNILVSEGQLTKAIELLENQLPHQHSDDIYNRLADICIQSQDYNKARSYYMTALR
jgi:tetratricopeptide (TPR) repeat protein